MLLHGIVRSGENLGKYIETKAEWRELCREELDLPQYTLAEEIVSSIVYGIATGLSVFGLALLLLKSPRDVLAVTSVSIYGSSMILLYLISTLYHALGLVKGKKVFQILDHCVVFLLIAGTYTPVALLCFNGVTGWVLFGIVWAISAAGIVLNAVNLARFRKFTTACYIGLGWIIIFFLKPLTGTMASSSLRLLFIGGILYTVGAVLYLLGKRFPHLHYVWHFFVVGGSILHYFMIYNLIIH